MIWYWIEKSLYLQEGMETEQQELGFKLVEQIFIGGIAIWHLIAKQEPGAFYRT